MAKGSRNMHCFDPQNPSARFRFAISATPHPATCFKFTRMFSFFCLILLLWGTCRVAPAGAEDLNAFAIYLENDYFAGEDGEYSSGLKLTWSSALRENYPVIWLLEGRSSVVWTGGHCY